MLFKGISRTLTYEYWPKHLVLFLCCKVWPTIGLMFEVTGTDIHAELNLNKTCKEILSKALFWTRDSLTVPLKNTN